MRTLASDQGRTLAHYLALPRPKDLVKAWIFPAAFLLGVAAGTGLDETTLLRALVVWLALELLIYQARYQWNDIRGFETDQRHPLAAERGRLPGPLSQARPRIAASAAVAAARLGLVGALAIALPSLDLGEPLAVLTLAVFGVALAYEALRERTASTRSSSPGVRPAVIATWVTVGAGYAIRGLGGLGLAVDFSARPGVAIAAGLSLWAFGVAFVTLRWALEAMPFANVAGGEVRWFADRDQAREHSLALTRWLPTSPPAGGLMAWRPLSEPTAATAPWNIATTFAGGSAAAAGVVLAHGAPAAALAAAVTGCGLALWVLAGGQSRTARWVLGLAALTCSMTLIGTADAALAAVPWALVTGSHLLFAAQSANTLGHPIRAGLLGPSGRSDRAGHSRPMTSGTTRA